MANPVLGDFQSPSWPVSFMTPWIADRPANKNLATQKLVTSLSIRNHGYFIVLCSDYSRNGNCWDNAVAESFFATLKVELVHDAAARRLHVGQDEDAAHDLFRRLRPRFSRRRLIRMR
jgi:hypothetical protein